MSRSIISFDFDDTLCMEDGTPNYNMMNLVFHYASKGYKCYIVTSRNQEHEDFTWIKENEKSRIRVHDFIQTHNLPIVECIYTNHEPKGPILKKLNSIKHYDNDEDELESALNCGVIGIKALLPSSLEK